MRVIAENFNLTVPFAQPYNTTIRAVKFYPPLFWRRHVRGRFLGSPNALKSNSSKEWRCDGHRFVDWLAMLKSP